MQLIKKASELQAVLAEARRGDKSVGFLPTMGALHEGHLTLARRAVNENDISVVSVFVNPTQFNNKTDLETYPRNVEEDARKLSEVGVDLVFAPGAEEFYTKEEMENRFEFDFGGLDQVMEGKFRPGHFNGVVQVVSKLFRLVAPTRAYFGEKDFQQLAIIRRMVKVMGFKLEIVGCPIVREESGLALSSRNALLTEEQRKLATNIHAVLAESRLFVGQTSVKELHDSTISAINHHDGLEVEYYDIVDGRTLKSVSRWDDTDYIVGCVTVYCGKVRLIDNIRLK
ncbi:MAG: pantoate--beta-alanine ligase [Paludibacteraceae bacterium]|nr:pantoate--beta-alanine ligase [Paludibacteraceae bacterium]